MVAPLAIAHTGQWQYGAYHHTTTRASRHPRIFQSVRRVRFSDLQLWEFTNKLNKCQRIVDYSVIWLITYKTRNELDVWSTKKWHLQRIWVISLDEMGKQGTSEHTQSISGICCLVENMSNAMWIIFVCWISAPSLPMLALILWALQSSVVGLSPSSLSFWVDGWDEVMTIWCKIWRMGCCCYSE